MYLLNNEVLKYIRLLAINNVNSHTIEWYTELAYRHYSKTYHTPLHVAKQVMNPAEIVKIYMEDEMLDMELEDVTAIRDKLVKTKKPFMDIENYQPAEELNEMDDEEWVMQQLAEADAREKAADKPKKNAGPSMGDAATMAQAAIKNLYNQINKPVPDQVDGDIKFPKE